MTKTLYYVDFAGTVNWYDTETKRTGNTEYLNFPIYNLEELNQDEFFKQKFYKTYEDAYNASMAEE